MNTTTFPNARQLLPEITDESSHTVEGQIAKAQWLADFAQRFGLGEVKVHPYPAGSPLGDKGLSNITVDIGGENGYDELLLAIAHFDVVTPSATQRKGIDGDTFHQRGSADMLGQLAGFLLAMRDIAVWNKRKMRFLLTTSEEMYSEGAFAAGHDSNNLAAGASALLTGDINVGTRTGEAPDLLIGGVGRVAGYLTMTAEEMHSAGVTDDQIAALLATKTGQVLGALPGIRYPEHPRDPQKLFPVSRAMARNWSSNWGSNSSLPTQSKVFTEIHYGHDGLTAEEIIGRTEEALGAILGNDGFSFAAEDRGGVPFSKPWLTDAAHPYVAHATRYATEVTGKQVKHAVYGGSSDARFVIDAASKTSGRTATTRLTSDGIIPAVGFYASGEGVHGPHENVSIASVEKLALFVRKLAAHEGPLTE